MKRTAIMPAQAHPWLMPLARYLRRKRWANNVARCQALRENFRFTSQRDIFDLEVRPFLESGDRIAYPDAFYYISIDDICRAAEAALTYDYQAPYQPQTRKG